MRPLLDLRLVDPTAAEPGLHVQFRDEARGLLFDLGEIGALAPRHLLRLSHVFVSHTHMDHFAGFDRLLATVLGRKERLVLSGGPRFVDQVEHKLRAYTWNVVHRYEVPLVLDVHEARPDGSAHAARFASPTAFAREGDATTARDGDVIHDEATFRVRARFVDHEMPVLAFALEEKARVRVAPDRLAALGVTSGAWLRELKQAVLTGAPDDTPIVLAWRDAAGEHTATRTVGELRTVVLDVVPGRRIGYVTDLRGSAANEAELVALLDGCDVLYIESVFLDADRDHAVRKNHLTARRAGEIARAVRARRLVPFHWSPRYEGREREVVAEALAAWGGATASA